MKVEGPCLPNASATNRRSATGSRPCQTAPNAVSIKTPCRTSGSTRPLQEPDMEAASSAIQTSALSAATGIATAAMRRAAGVRARARSDGARSRT